MSKKLFNKEIKMNSNNNINNQENEGYQIIQQLFDNQN